MDRKIINKFIKPTGGCIKCAKCTHVRTSFFCGNTKLTNKQLYNEKGYCSEFVPKCGADMKGELEPHEIDSYELDFMGVEPDATTDGSNVVKKGGNDKDRTTDDLISRQAAKDIFTELYGISAIGSIFDKYEWADICETTANELPSAQPQQIVRCKDCKHNPKLEWFGCPMSHLNEKQRPETAWCWKGERKDDE